MKEVIIASNAKDISFEDFLTLYRIYYKCYLTNGLSTIIKILEDKLFDISIEEIRIIPLYGEKHYSFVGKNIQNGMPISKTIAVNDSVAYHWDDININYELRRLETLYQPDKLKGFSKSFQIKNATVKLNIDFTSFLDLLWPLPKMIPIRIRSGAKIDIYLYNLETGKLCIENKGKIMELSKNMQIAIMSLLPRVQIEAVPFLDHYPFIFQYGESVYRDKDGKIEKGQPGFIKTLQGCVQCTIFSMPDEAEKSKEQVQPSFQEMVNGASPYSIDTTTNSEAIIANIKNLLTKIKESDVKIGTTPKIKLSNILFFSEITDKKKTIDPFFKDPDIIKYCDLSDINFENADIRYAYLAHTNAQIDLSKVYGKSIEGADLEDIPLYGQSLDGINANKANLCGTGVFVSVDRTSIIDTKFSDSSRFMLGITTLDMEQIRAMGINVIEDTPGEDLINLSL